MNDDFPKLTTAGFDLLSTMTTGGWPGRIAINPFDPSKYDLDGHRVSTRLVNKLVEQGYFSGSPFDKPLIYDLTEQARSLACPQCRGAGMVGRAADEPPCALYGTSDIKVCPKCSGRRIIAPGTAHTPPYTVPERRPAKAVRRAKERPRRAEIDHSPQGPGYYWLALDDGGDWLQGSPFLVKLTSQEQECGLEVRHGYIHTTVVFLDGPWSMTDHATADLVSDPGGGLHHFRQGTIHRISCWVGIGGFVTATHVEEARLNWLGEAVRPGLPKELHPVDE